MIRQYRWALLACSASKGAAPAPARELYTGALFRLGLELAQLVADEVLVLSAKHHVLTLDQVVEPYDVSLTSMGRHEREVWGANVVRALNQRFGLVNPSNHAAGVAVGQEVLCLAPGSYLSAIGFNYWLGSAATPLKGLGIGEQKARLKALLVEARATRRRIPEGLAARVLAFDAAYPGAPGAPMELTAEDWSSLVRLAREEMTAGKAGAA